MVTYISDVDILYTKSKGARRKNHPIGNYFRNIPVGSLVFLGGQTVEDQSRSRQAGARVPHTPAVCCGGLLSPASSGRKRPYENSVPVNVLHGTQKSLE